MRRFIVLLLLFSILTASAFTFSGAVSEAPMVGADSYIVIDAATGMVLAENNADARKLIASTTKVMTALVAIENANLSEIVAVNTSAVGVEGSSIYLDYGEKISMEALLYGLILESGNDAAAAIAYHIGGSIENFAAMMNDKAKSLGLKNTNFANPHGLDDEDHYSSARDLAIIMAAAMKYDIFAKISATKSIRFGERVFYNHNKLLWRYDGVDAGKTGYTEASGRSLISSCVRNGMRLICVTINDADDWNDHAVLYDWAYSRYTFAQITKCGEPYMYVPTICGSCEYVAVVSKEDCSVLLDCGDTLNISVELPKFVYAGISAGETAGQIKISINGELRHTVPLNFADDVSLDQSQKLTVLGKIKRGLILGAKYGLSRG